MEKRIYKPPHFRDSEAFYSENYKFNEISIPVGVQKFVIFYKITYFLFQFFLIWRELQKTADDNN